MAEIAKTIIDFGDTGKEIIFTASTGSDYIVLDNADQRMELLIKNQNTVSATVTIKAGDGAISSMGDAVITVGAGKSAVVPISRLGSARIKALSGANKGRAVINAAAASGGSVASILLGAVSVL